jgi:hypothetical protein
MCTHDFRNHDNEPPGRGLKPRLPKRALEVLTTHSWQFKELLTLEVLTTQFLIKKYSWQFKELLTPIMAAKRHRELRKRGSTQTYLLLCRLCQ